MGEKPSFFSSKSFNRREARLAQRFLKKVIVEENNIIDARSQAHFAANFFDTNAIRQWEQKNLNSASVLKREIMEKYSRQTTMYGRLALFLSDQYFPFLKTIDLGKTLEAQDPTKIDELRYQYREVRTVIEEAFDDVEELPREKSERTIHFRHDALVTENHLGKKNVDTPMWLIGERNRTLLQFRYGESGDVVSLPKRMTFGARQDLPAHLPYPVNAPLELADEDGRVRDPDQLAIMEEALDRGHPLLPGIRTLYFVAKRRHKN